MVLKHHSDMFREQLEIDWYDIDLRQKRVVTNMLTPVNDKLRQMDKNFKNIW